jgi:single-stranded DNA-binding protein
MSFFVLISGVCVADPQSREGSKGPFTTAAVRVGDSDEAFVANVIAFGELASRLAEEFSKGSTIALSGRARLSSWTGRDGSERHGLSVVAAQIIGLKEKRTSAESFKPSVIRKRASAFLAPSGEVADDSVSDLFREGSA